MKPWIFDDFKRFLDEVEIKIFCEIGTHKGNTAVQMILHLLSKNNKFKYKINGKIYIIPNLGFQIKIWDFDFACINNIVENSKVNAEWTNRINVNNKPNRYYDVHYFLAH